MDVREYDLNLIPGSVPEIVKINQYDKGIQYAFTIYQGEKKFSIPAGSTVLLTGTKPDGLGFTYSCTFSGAVVSVTIGDQVAVLNGKVDAEITIISSSSVRLGTANFVFLVEPAALQDDTAVSDSDFPAIVKAADHIDDAKKYADNAAQSAKDAKASASSAASAAKNAIADEVTRAKAAEAANAKAITDETARAKKAEEANTKSITDETTRAKAAEAANSKAVTAETTRAKKAEEANANAIATKMDADPALFSRVASTDINRVGFSYVKILTDAPDGVNAYGHIFIDAEPGRMGGDLDNKVIFYVPYNTGRVFFRLVHDGKADDWVEIAPYSAVTTLSNKLIALGTDSYSLVDFVNDKIQFNSNDDYLHARIQLDYLSGKVNEELRKFFFLGPTNPAIYQMRDIANSLRSFVMCNAMFLDAYVEVLDQYKCFVDLLLRSFSARDLFDKDFDSDASNFREKKAHKIDLYFMLKSFTSTQFGIELTTYHLNDIELYDDGLEYVKKVVPIILGRNLYDNAVAMCYEMIPHLAIDGDIAKYILEIIQKTIRKGLIPSICLKISDFIYRNFTPENDSDAHEENDLRDNTYFTKDGGYIHFFEKVVEASVPDCSDNVNIQTMLGELAYQWPARYLRCESSYISKIIRQPSNIKLAIAISKCLIDEDLQSVKNHLQRLLPMNDIQLYSKAILRDLIEPEEESEKSFIEELKSRVNKEIENRNKPFRSFPSPYEDYFSKLITLVLNNKTKTITVDTLKANLLEDNAKGRFLIAVADESDNKADFESVEPDWLKNYSPALLKHIAQNDAASTVIREKFREYSEQNGSRVDIELYKIFFKWFAVPVKKEQKAEELS